MVNNDLIRIEERRQRVASLYIRGLTQSQIAERVGVSQQMVSIDLKALREQWKASASRDYQARLSEELARLDEAESEAWTAWERSCRPVRRGPYLIERNGDARLLAEIRHCIELRLRVIGALKPNQTSVNLVNINWDAIAGAAEAPDPVEEEIRLAGLLPAPGSIGPPSESDSVREAVSGE